MCNKSKRARYALRQERRSGLMNISIAYINLAGSGDIVCIDYAQHASILLSTLGYKTDLRRRGAAMPLAELSRLMLCLELGYQHNAIVTAQRDDASTTHL